MNNTTHSNFESSVERFSHNDVRGDIASEKKAMLPALLIRSALIAVLIGLFSYASYMLIASALQTEEVNELYGEILPENTLSAVKHSAPLPEPTSMYTLEQMINSNGEYLNYIGGNASVEDSQRRSDYYRNYMKFKSKYEDAYAWIYVDYTKINYPILKHSSDTNFYLFHDFNGKDLSSGCITAEFSMSDDWDANINNVIYGHCMKNGSMFRTLKTFMESANRNTLVKTMNIEIYTEKGLYIYKVLTGYRNATTDFTQTIFANSDEYLAFLNKIVGRNTLRINREYNAESRICTLITCANVNNNDDERYVVHGILTSFIPAAQL